MPGDDFKKVRRGEAFRISASTYNALLDAATAYHRRAHDLGAPSKPRSIRTGAVLVQNQSGSALDQYAVVELGSPIILPTENEQAFRARVTFKVTTPGDSPGPMAILQEPVAAGGVGRAIVFGVTPVRLKVTDESHEYAEVTPSESGYLTSAPTGSARVLYKEEGTEEVWAIVYFPASVPSGPVRLSGLAAEREDGAALTVGDDGAVPQAHEVPLNEALRIIEVEDDQFRLALNLQTLYVLNPETEEFEPLSDVLRFPRCPSETQVVGHDSEGEETPDPTEFVVGTNGRGLELWQQTRMGYFHEGDHKLYMYVRKALFDERGCLYSISGETRVEVEAPVVESEDGGGGLGDMLKSVYDCDDDGRVDKAEALDDGSHLVSAEDARTHLDDASIHREIHDEGSGPTDLWSASKIIQELEQKADTDHEHVAAEVTDFEAAVDDHPNVAANTAARHARQHPLNSTLDHEGIQGTENHFMAIDAHGLPKDSGTKAADFAPMGHGHVAGEVSDFNAAVANHPDVAANSAARHARQHPLNSTLDHEGIQGTPDHLMALDADGLPKDSGKKITDFAASHHFHGTQDIDELEQYVSDHPDVVECKEARYKVKATADDENPGYLADKVVGADGSVIVENGRIQLEGDGIPYYAAYYGTQDNTGAKTWYPLPYEVRPDSVSEPGYLDALVQKSIVLNPYEHKIELDGDEESPGAHKVYGTDEAGNKGWQELQHEPPHPPSEVEVIGSPEEGDEPADESTFDVGQDGKGLDVWIVSRIGYFHAGHRKLYMYMRKLGINETGHVVWISGETRVEVEAPVVEG